jgi:hypothetical protein
VCPADALAPADTACPDEGNACTANVCTGTSVVCTHPPLADETPCNDGDACTQTDACDGGTCVGSKPIVCDDGVECTRDRCVAGVCLRDPDSTLCDTVECAQATCRPGAAGTDAKGCIRTPVDEGEACTDDGFACTSDVCRGGTCAHDRVDARCSAADDCGTAVCFPGFPTADGAGCAPGAPNPDGGECTEDGDPCTDDACQAGTCGHANVPDRGSCDPVQTVFRNTRALRGQMQAAGLVFAASVTDGPGGGGASLRTAIAARLDEIDRGLEQAERILAGRSPIGAGRGTLAQQRARAAQAVVKPLPNRAQSIVSLIQLARKRRELGSALAKSLQQRARGLLTATKALKRDLRRLQRINQSFAR